MPRNSNGRNRNVVANRTMQSMRELYLRQFAAISDDIYYSLVFERDYPVLSRVFESAAMGGVDSFRNIGAMIVELGGDPSLNARIGQGRVKPMDIFGIRADDIDRIIRYTLERERGIIKLCDGIMSTSDDAELLDKISCMSLKREELCGLLERMLNS